jgi:hypothetical protein
MAHRRFLTILGSIVLAATVTPTAKANDTPASSSRPTITVTPPAGFEDLTGPQQVMLDVYLGGTRVGEAMAVVQPGHFRFVDASTLVESLPDIADRPRLLAVLGAPDLDPHSEAICRAPGTAVCPKLAPQVAAIVYDGARYRVDIIVDPGLLTIQAIVRTENLPPPADTPALINFLSGTISGGRDQKTQYYLQDTAVVAAGTGRIRARFQQASYSGFQTDTLAGELDRPGLRYTAGAFWIPGNSLLDRAKILGAGLSTQFATRLDHDQLMGSPLILFLDQRARVDILVNGNIMASSLYDAGNQTLDTSALPEGSYTVTLRISPASGGVREEQRFFSRSSTLPMIGHDAFLFYAGVLVRNSEGLIGDITRTPIFQGSWAHRVNPGLSVNVGLIGTGRRQWATTGATVLNGAWQLDTSVQVSNRGGLGVYGHIARTGTARLTLDLDARRVSNPGGGPLLAATTVILPVAGGLEYTPYAGAYTQVSGAVGYRLGQGRLALVGTYRRQAGSRDYSLGPALYMPLLRRDRFVLDFNGSYTATRTGRQAYFGVNLTITKPRTAYTVNGGAQFRPGRSNLGDTVQGGFNVSRQFDDVAGAQVQADGGVQHANGISYAQGQVQARSTLGDGNLNFVQPLSGGATQFGASINTAMVVAKGGLRFNEARNGDAMVMVHIAGAASDADFEVLVDDRVVGTARRGKDLTVTLPSYRVYAVRLRAKGLALSDYDQNPRRVSLYPGNVVRLAWSARSVTAVFGRLLRPDGQLLANAEITADGDLAQSDEQGHFLIQTSPGATLIVRTRNGFACTVALGTIAPVNSYAAIGDQHCQPVPARMAAPPPLPSPLQSKVSP